MTKDEAPYLHWKKARGERGSVRLEKGLCVTYKNKMGYTRVRSRFAQNNESIVNGGRRGTGVWSSRRRPMHFNSNLDSNGRLCQGACIKNHMPLGLCFKSDNDRAF